jgi:tetratricopeptide (TPR) repeat protein
MDTNTAPTASPNPPTAQALWQAPIFVAGVLALIGVWFARPLLHGGGCPRPVRDLATARQILGRVDGDAAYALELVQKVLESPELPPEKQGEATFLAGTAYVRLAEKAGPVADRASWAKARELLAQAESAELSEEDRHLLRYRLGVAGYYTGDDNARVLSNLEEAVGFVENPAEGYRLIQNAYLRQKPPDLAKALEANRKLRNSDASLSEQTEAKLAGGEILLRMGKPAEARDSLKHIPETAPPATLVKARLLMAKSHQEEKQWGEAVRLYVLVLNETRVPLPEPAVVHYNRGVCYRQLGQVIEAAKAWRTCLKEANGPEVQAAALSLADLQIADPNPDPVGMLTVAVAQVASPAAWTNPLIDLARTQDIFERAIQTLRQAAQYEPAARVVEQYARIAAPRKIIVLQAETKAEWANAMLDAAKGKPAEEQPAQAKQLLAQSAEAFGKLADEPGLSPAERSTYLWACAQSAIAGQQDGPARERLEAFVLLGLDAKKMGEAWYQLGELYRKANNKDQAGVAYRKCQQFDDIRATCKANYQLAMAALEANDPEEAEIALILNLKMLRFENDPEAPRQTLFTLGDLLYQRKQYARLVRYLEDALGKFKDSPEVFLARYQLADSYRQLGLQSFLTADNRTESRLFLLAERKKWQQKAADEFAALEALLDTPQGKDVLTPALRKSIPFTAAKCLYTAGQTKEALAIYQKLAERYAGKVEALDALGGAVACHDVLRQDDHVAACLIQIQKMLPEMPSDVRVVWERWLEDAKKSLQRSAETKP